MTHQDIADYFDIDPVAEGETETPVPVVNLDVARANLRNWQARCDTLGLNNRPHIKTHKLVGLARYQIDLGAVGITVQKLGEAEVMADAGIGEILMTFNVVGTPKLRRLGALAKRTNISVVADSAAVVAGLGSAARDAGRDISVLVECETGAARNGVATPAAAADLARLIAGTPGLRYGGLMTYPAPGTRIAAAGILAEARDLLARTGLETDTVSSGGTPEMWKDDGLEPVTEYRAGTYIYFDRSQIAADACTLADCALRVRATVVSVPTGERAIIDAGSKALTSDLLGLPDFGCVPELDDARVYNLSEEHGFLNISHLTRKPAVGDIVDIVPNHVCPVSNLFDRIALSRHGKLLGLTRVDARGQVW